MLSSTRRDPSGAPPALPLDPPDRTARRSRAAAVGLVLVLLAISTFAVWSSQATSRSARSAGQASRLSDDYQNAAQAVAAEEPLERKYRLEPGPDVRARSTARRQRWWPPWRRSERTAAPPIAPG